MNHISIQEIMSRDLSQRELQDVLIGLIQSYNKLAIEFARLQQTGQIPSRQRHSMDVPYGL